MIWMPMYIHVIFSYLAAVGFAVFLNSPKKTLYVAGSIGMISWVIYVLLMRINIDMMTSNFIAASIAALLSEILARKMKYTYYIICMYRYYIIYSSWNNNINTRSWII